MSNYTDENGEQLYPTGLVIDTRPAEYHTKVQIEYLKNPLIYPNVVIDKAYKQPKI